MSLRIVFSHEKLSEASTFNKKQKNVFYYSDAWLATGITYYTVTDTCDELHDSDQHVIGPSHSYAILSILMRHEYKYIKCGILSEISFLNWFQLNYAKRDSFPLLLLLKLMHTELPQPQTHSLLYITRFCFQFDSIFSVHSDIKMNITLSTSFNCITECASTSTSKPQTIITVAG